MKREKGKVIIMNDLYCSLELRIRKLKGIIFNFLHLLRNNLLFIEFYIFRRVLLATQDTTSVQWHFFSPKKVCYFIQDV